MTPALKSKTAYRSLLGLRVGPVIALALATAFSLVAVPTPDAHASPADAGLASRIRKVMAEPAVRQAKSAAIVMDGSDGRQLYARSAGRASTPASNTKIVTAVTALDVLGPNYRFKTQVIRRGRVSDGRLAGNLYLKGYGDPTLRQSDLRTLARKVRAAGIRTVTGSVVADASFFDNQHYNPGWDKSYADAYYAAPVFGLTLAPDADYDPGTVQINYAAGRSAGKPARISFTPAAAKSYLTVSDRVTTAKRGAATTFSASRAYGSATIKLRGRVARGHSTGHVLVSVSRPDLLAADVFRSELARAGVTVRGRTKSMATPTRSRTVIAGDTSMPLSKLLVPFLKLSNNAHAEALTKAMGARKGRPGNWSDGISYIKTYLRQLGVTRNVHLIDGSGLSRADKLTPRGVAKVLYKVQRAPWFKAFYAALPVAGNPHRMVGGSLSNRMRHTVAADNARAKTGSLTGVTALSGYVRGRDGRRYVFSMISSYTGASPRPAEDRLVRTLANRRR